MKSLRTIIGLIVVALISCGCDSDQDVPGNNNPPVCTGDKTDQPGCIEPDTTKSPPGDDVWVGEDIDPEEDTEAKLDLFELCGGYVGTWDCDCVTGVCEGMFSILDITIFEVLEYQHTFWVQKIYPDYSMQSFFVCNGPPPAESGTGAYFYPPDDEGVLTLEVINPYRSNKLEYIQKCTRHPTD